MKVNSIIEIMQSNKFVLVRLNSGYKRIGINCGIINIPSVMKNLYKKKAGHIISMTPCNINEYISSKTPFLTVYKS